MSITGAVDGFGIRPFQLTGWAKNESGKPLYVEARFDSLTIAGTATNIVRSDLGGLHGFRLELPGEQLEHCRRIIARRLLIYAVSSNEETELDIFHNLERSLLSMLLVASVRLLPTVEKASFVTSFLKEINAGRTPSSS